MEFCKGGIGLQARLTDRQVKETARCILDGKSVAWYVHDSNDIGPVVSLVADELKDLGWVPTTHTRCSIGLGEGILKVFSIQQRVEGIGQSLGGRAWDRVVDDVGLTPEQVEMLYEAHP